MRKLNRYSEHRISMLKNLCEAVITHGKIETTLYRAKEVKRIIDPLITRAKVENLHNRRLLLSYFNNHKAVVEKLFKVGKMNETRMGGYTTMIRSGFRSDSGVKALIKIIDYPSEVGNDQGNI